MKFKFQINSSDPDQTALSIWNSLVWAHTVCKFDFYIIRQTALSAFLLNGKKVYAGDSICWGQSVCFSQPLHSSNVFTEIESPCELLDSTKSTAQS